MRTATVIDSVCETYVPHSGHERIDWLRARATDENAINSMYNALVHATDFLPSNYLDFCRERLIAVWIQHNFDGPMPEFLKLISYEQGKSCALLNEEQRAYIEVKMQHAICELAEACNYAIESSDAYDESDEDDDDNDDDDDECPAPHRGNPAHPFSLKEVAHDME